MTFGKNAALAIDYFWASLLFNQRCITISGLTWALENNPKIVDELKLSAWQVALLKRIGPWLDKHWPNHREQARVGDIARINAARSLLA